MNGGKTQGPDNGAHKQKVHWQANDYDESMSFVSRYGEDLVEWLKPVPGETVLDFGCGTGDLAARISSKGAVVHGLDISPEMVERARAKYPQLAFHQADGTNWRADFAYDAVFSNAALHWMKDANAAVRSMASGLKAGGRLAVEFGGRGNVETIVTGVEETLRESGKEEEFEMPWFFPTIGEYAGILERHGLEVRFASLLDRPTVLSGGESGMRQWLEMFGTALFPRAKSADVGHWIGQASEKLKPRLFDGRNWTADYRRIRIYAVKIG